MPVTKAFIDTNIFVYLYSDTEPEKRKIATRQINQYDRFVSTQVLNEFSNICIRKMRLENALIISAVKKICSTCTLSLIDDETVAKALLIHKKYSFSYYDSLIVASAIESGCKYLITEDMHAGQILENSLTIKNIFL